MDTLQQRTTQEMKRLACLRREEAAVLAFLQERLTRARSAQDAA